VTLLRSSASKKKNLPFRPPRYSGSWDFPKAVWSPKTSLCLTGSLLRRRFSTEVVQAAWAAGRSSPVTVLICWRPDKVKSGAERTTRAFHQRENRPAVTWRELAEKSLLGLSNPPGATGSGRDFCGWDDNGPVNIPRVWHSWGFPPGKLSRFQSEPKIYPPSLPP